MRNKQLLRYSLASLTLLGAGLGTFLIACGDDDSTSTPVKTDSGTTDAPNTTPDTGAPGPDASKEAGPSPARLQFINAATDLGPSNKSGGLRICFGAGITADNIKITGLPAMPDQSPSPGVPPGAYIGTGGNVTGTGLPLEGLFVQPLVMNAERLFAHGIVKPGPGQPGTTCEEMLAANFDAGGGPLVENVDYWKLPVIPANTFLPEKSYILVLTGCTQDTEEAPAKCGPGADPDGGAGVGNLQVRIYEVDRATAVAGDKIGAQFIHAAAPAKVGPLASIGFVPAFVRDAADGGSTPISNGGAVVDLYGKTDLAQVPDITLATDFFTINSLVPTVSIPLTAVQAISFPAGVPDGGEYRNGAGFTFVAVGDPAADPDAGGKFNTRTFHYLGLPNNPPVSIYKP